MIEKVKIAAISVKKEVSGNYGPQKLISIKQDLEQGDRWLSGFVASDKLENYSVGSVHDLDVTQKDKFWNFKVVGKKALEAEEVKRSGDKVMDALGKIYKKLLDIERRLPDAPIEKVALEVFDEPFEEL